MTLKSLLKVFSETRYMITALDVASGNYETIRFDYTNVDENFGKALETRYAWTRRKNKIFDISYNKPAGCIEIRVDLLDYGRR